MLVGSLSNSAIIEYLKVQISDALYQVMHLDKRATPRTQVKDSCSYERKFINVRI